MPSVLRLTDVLRTITLQNNTKYDIQNIHCGRFYENGGWSPSQHAIMIGEKPAKVSWDDSAYIVKITFFDLTSFTIPGDVDNEIILSVITQDNDQCGYIDVYSGTGEDLVLHQNDLVVFIGNGEPEGDFSAYRIPTKYSDLLNIPNLATVATSGNYNDLDYKPTFSAGTGINIRGSGSPGYDWDYEIEFVGDADEVDYDNSHLGLSATNVEDAIDELAAEKADASSLARVATTGQYIDLTGQPTVPSALSELSDDTTHRVVTDTEKSTWNGKQDALTAGSNISISSNTLSVLSINGWTLPKKGDSLTGGGSSTSLRFNTIGASLTGGGKQLYVHLPFPFPPSLPNITYCRISVRQAQNANYAYAKEGSSYYALDATNTQATLTNNGTKRSSVSSITFGELGIHGFNMTVNFEDVLAITSSGTAMNNNSPISMFIELKGTWST